MKHTIPSKLSKNIAVAALSIGLVVENKKVPSEIQLTPVGFFKAKDGRPVELVDGWYIDQSVAEKLIEYSSYSNDRVIDYEHQTLLKEQNGQPAPAAGWFSTFQWRESGLWAVNVTWTPSAEQMILDGAYRYISPVIIYDQKTGHVLDVIMAAITNDPAIDGMQNLAKLTAQNLQQLINQQQEDYSMDLKKLLIALGLPEGTTEEEALAALTALKSDNGTAQASVAALTTQIEAQANADPDPAKFVPIEVVSELKTQMAALSSQSVEAMVDQAIEDKKLLPAEKLWAISLGNSNMAALTQHIDKSIALASLSSQQVKSGKKPPVETATAALTADQKQIRQAFGFTDEDHQS